MKRGVGIGLAVLLAAAVVVAIVFGGRLGGGGNGSATPEAPGLTAVRGVVGSEKYPLFADQRVKDRLAALGLRVEVDAAGSREIATLPTLAQRDFAFPSSVPAADKIIKDKKVTVVGTSTPFHSPIAVASFRPIVEQVLAPQKIATKGPGGAWSFDLKAYLALAEKKTRWDAIPGNTVYPAGKTMLVTTTDVRRSNSAAMYLALTSYVANGGHVVATAPQARTAAGRVAPLFLDQGYTQGSSEAPFEDYLSMGMGKTPMVLIYESQFLGRQLAKDGSITQDMVLLYPKPDILSKHTFVALTPGGKRLSEALATDPELAKLAAAHGFRPTQRALFTQTLSEAGITPPPELVDVVEPPTFEVLEQLITTIEKQY